MRDPRTDPRPGDVLIFGPQWQQERYQVMGTDGGVKYTMSDSRFGHTCTIAQWRKWAAGASIVRVAEEKNSGGA